MIVSPSGMRKASASSQVPPWLIILTPIYKMLDKLKQVKVVAVMEGFLNGVDADKRVMSPFLKWPSS